MVSTDAAYVPPLERASCLAPFDPDWPSYASTYRLLTASKTNAVGADGVPPWFARLLAPFIAEPLSLLYALSIHYSFVPSQWKSAIITPVPKIPSPSKPADYRPISVLPLFSTILEKLVVRRFLYPIFLQPPLSSQLSDQFAFRPTGSTTAALVTLLDRVTTLLTTQPYVHLIALDFSKAFDVARHSTLFEKLSNLPLPDPIYSWFLSFFHCRSHQTKFAGELSHLRHINSSVVQGSATGPPMFIVSTSDLHAVTPGNSFSKYADDGTLVVPASNSSSIPTELANVATWSGLNNQTLNISKSTELIVSRRWTRGLVQPPPTAGVTRADTLLLLGVLLDNHLSFAPHVSKTLAQAAQSLHALKVLKTSGLPMHSLTTVCRATLAARLTYASPAWWAATSEADKGRLQGALKRAVKWGVSNSPPLDFESLCRQADETLFNAALQNSSHVLHSLLPPVRQHNHRLRNRRHPLVIPLRTKFTDLNFCQRMLFPNHPPA